METSDLGLIDRVNQGYSSLWKLLIKPERFTYEEHSLGLQVRNVRNKLYKRHDFQVRSFKGFMMECSYFEPLRGDKNENASWSTSLGNSDGLIQTESIYSDCSE